MANELQISHSAYRKIENNQSKLTVERLIQIAQIFNTTVSNLFDESSTRIYNQNNNKDSTVISNHEFDNFYHENKELSQKYTHTLEDEIGHLKSEIIFLRELLNKNNLPSI